MQPPVRAKQGFKVSLSAVRALICFEAVINTPWACLLWTSLIFSLDVERFRRGKANFRRQKYFECLIWMEVIQFIYVQSRDCTNKLYWQSMTSAARCPCDNFPEFDSVTNSHAVFWHLVTLKNTDLLLQLDFLDCASHLLATCSDTPPPSQPPCCPGLILVWTPTSCLSKSWAHIHKQMMISCPHTHTHTSSSSLICKQTHTQAWKSGGFFIRCQTFRLSENLPVWFFPQTAINTNLGWDESRWDRGIDRTWWVPQTPKQEKNGCERIYYSCQSVFVLHVVSSFLPTATAALACCFDLHGQVLQTVCWCDCMEIGCVSESPQTQCRLCDKSCVKEIWVQTSAGEDNQHNHMRALYAPPPTATTTTPVYTNTAHLNLCCPLHHCLCPSVIQTSAV